MGPTEDAGQDTQIAGEQPTEAARGALGQLTGDNGEVSGARRNDSTFG